MAETITATGLVATEPKHLTTSSGLELTSFRLASSQRRYNKASGAWEFTESNWFTVTAFRRLAAHTHTSVKKGDRVIVTGRMRINNWQSDTNSGTSVEITADSIGHDLNAGTAVFERVRRRDSEQGQRTEGAGVDADSGAGASGGSEQSGTATFTPQTQGGWAAEPGDAPSSAAAG